MQKKKKPVVRSSKPFVRFRGHIWLDGNEGTFLGYGRVVLLERIRELGSITKAARSMELSYRRAWVLIDSMNRQAPKPFVVTAAGGKGGGGTLVTEEGEKAIKIFWKFHADFQKFLEHEEKKSGYKKKSPEEE
ncbi:MAG: LysR family transcriptional regulator [Nitrospirae bacterium]|nr:LysR family transcriptional regulator [Nitrospirota bacterium]